MNTPLRLLVVEDSEDDALLLARRLRQAGYEPMLERVETPEAMAAALDRQAWDVILADYTMPHFSGLDALRLLKERSLDIPFIIVSGTIGEETAVAAMKAGAHDYVRKDNLARLIPAIEREIREAAGRRARLDAERALREAEEEKKQFYRDVVRAVTGGRLLLHERGEMPRLCAEEPVAIRQARDIREVRAHVRARALAAGMSGERVDDLELIVAEAAANAWKHAGGGTVSVCTIGDALRVSVVDQGRGIAPHQLARAAFEKGYSTAQTMGAGFTLMLTLADRVHLVTDPHGTTVVLEMCRQQPREPEPWESWGVVT